MSGVSPKLPLGSDGATSKFALNTTFKEAIKQNFKHMLLTIPGERMMNPRFGAGIIKLLFEQQDTHSFRETIASKIDEQIELYMPFLTITKLTFIGTEESVESDPNTFRMVIEYEVPSLSVVDFLDITV